MREHGDDASTLPTVARHRRWLPRRQQLVAGFPARRAFVGVALFVEASSAWLLLDAAATRTTMLFGLALHVGAAVLVAWALWGPRADRARAIVCGAVSLLAFPLVGMLGMVAGLVVTANVVPRQRDVASLAGLENPSDLSRLLDSRRPIDVQNELAIEPIVDLLREDDIDVKREAIDALVRVDRRFAVRVLQDLIRDPHGDVRLYASIALSRIEDDVAREMLHARQAASLASAHAAPHAHLASLYVDYGLSGLVNGGARHRFFALARDEYEVACELAPDDGRSASSLGRVHLLCEQRQAALSTFANALARDPSCLDARLGLMELAFQDREFGDLAGHAASTLPVMGRDHPQRALVEWWASSREVTSGRG